MCIRDRKYAGNKPECFTAAVRKTGNLSFAGLLQSDGSPYGGSIESQHMEDPSFDIPSNWGQDDRAPRRGLRAPDIREY